MTTPVIVVYQHASVNTNVRNTGVCAMASRKHRSSLLHTFANGVLMDHPGLAGDSSSWLQSTLA
jgi:hypothetical protein